MRLSVALRLVALAQLFSTSSAQQQKPWLEAFPIVYVLYGPKGPIARAVVDADDACPELVHAGDTLPVKIRGVGDNVMPSAFLVRVCDGPLPRVSSGATFGGKPLPSTTDNPERFLLMGDTGLRIKPSNNGDCASNYTGDKLYGVHTECSDPIDYDVEKVYGHFQGVDEPMEVAWPLKEGVVAKAAAEGADLLLHVGDYLYRQGPCPESYTCATAANDPVHFNEGAPQPSGYVPKPPGMWGDNWYGWWADFFETHMALFAAVPWIALRGNHENCERAGHGYFLFIDTTYEYDAIENGCTDRSPMFAVPFEQTIWTVDIPRGPRACPPGCVLDRANPTRRVLFASFPDRCPSGCKNAA